ncbi:MAG: helix-turn-helix domain-containing protein [Micrococcales bacterium]|nr:helix-turn-helix domain-containing protein [Micrococcales bacterium]
MRSLTGLSLAEVASRTQGVLNPTLVNKIELGIRRVQATDLVLLGFAFGVSPEVLLLPWPGDPEAQGWGKADDAIHLPYDDPAIMWSWARGETEPDAPPTGASPEARLTRKARACVFTNPAALARLAAEPTRDMLHTLMREHLAMRLDAVVARWATTASEISGRWAAICADLGDDAVAAEIARRSDLRDQHESDLTSYLAWQSERVVVQDELESAPSWLADRVLLAKLNDWHVPALMNPHWEAFLVTLDASLTPSDEFDPAAAVPTFDDRWT